MGFLGIGGGDVMGSWDLRLKNCASANSFTKCAASRGSMW